ncbi:MAG: hypothetical protein NC399_00505 [Muribaculum sp.]|nr:hypothetical protein [Muribaculum sp.]
MKNRIIRNIITTVSVLSCALCLSVTPVSAASSAAAPQAIGSGTTIEPHAADRRWVYKEENNKLYKRIFNYSTHQWEGEWIFVRNL